MNGFHCATKHGRIKSQLRIKELRWQLAARRLIHALNYLAGSAGWKKPNFDKSFFSRKGGSSKKKSSNRVSDWNESLRVSFFFHFFFSPVEIPAGQKSFLIIRLISSKIHHRQKDCREIKDVRDLLFWVSFQFWSRYHWYKCSCSIEWRLAMLLLLQS